MPQYKVTVSMDIEAEDKIEAAMESQNQMHEPADWIFDVMDKGTGKTETIEAYSGNKCARR